MNEADDPQFPEDPAEMEAMQMWNRAGMVALLCLARVVIMLDEGIDPEQFHEVGRPEV